MTSYRVFEYFESAIQIWTGYKQSVRPGSGMLTVTLDVSYTVFLEKAPVIKFVAVALPISESEVVGIKAGNPLFNRAEAAIKGVKVTFAPWHNLKLCLWHGDQ